VRESSRSTPRSVSARGIECNRSSSPRRSQFGAGKRRALIDAHFGSAAFETIRGRYQKKDVADDDILDAFAALWTAERIVNRQSATLPQEPQKDSAGLPMQMVY
jgi:predicted RNase H-like nuclease